MSWATTRFWRGLGTLVVLAAVVRAAYYLLLARHVGGLGDFLFFHGQANLLATGHGFIDPFDHAYGVDRASAGHPPLWPLTLAVPSLLGLDSIDAHRATGLAIGCVVVALVALVGRRIGGPRAGLIAGALACVHPVLVGADGSLLSEPLYGALALGMVWAAVELRERPTAGRALALGALGGLATLTRGEGWLLTGALAIAAAAWAPAAAGRRAALVGLAAAALIVVVAPWTIRNAIALHGFIPVSTNDSTVLAGANCPLTYAGPNLGSWDLSCIAVPPRPYRVDEAVLAARWRRAGVRYALHHAGRWPVVVPIRVLRTFDLWQPRRQTQFAEGRNRRVAEAGDALWLLAFAPLGAAGLVLLRRRRGPAGVLLAAVAAVALTSALGYGAPRFRHPVDLVSVLAAAVALDAVVARRVRA